MTFRQLRFAVEVAKYASINKAAEHLYTHQSNVSNVIKQLEEELGIQIFWRTQKGVLVTEDGREFLSYAEDLLQKKSFVESLYAKGHSRKQYFSVSSMRSYFLSVPISRLQPYLSSNLEEQIYIRLKKQSLFEVLDDVQNSRSELGILFIMKSQKKQIQHLASVKGLNYFELGESRVNIVLREDHPIFAQYSDEDLLEHITEYPYVIVEREENFSKFYDEASNSILEVFHDPPKCTISANDSAACQNIIAESDCFFISCNSWKHGKYYKFASLPLRGEDGTLIHYYVTRKGPPLSELAKRYIEELKKMFEAP